MDADTDLGGRQVSFPLTRGSMVRDARSTDPGIRRRALEEVVVGYWKPVYKYLRLRWRLGNEDAKDATQSFFAVALEKEYLHAYDPTRARFRTFLRVCVDRYLAKQWRAAATQSRGGQVRILPLDFEAADGELAAARVPSSDDPEQIFHREWMRDLFARAVAALREEWVASGRSSMPLQVFERYDLSDQEPRPTYAEVGNQLGISVSQVTNSLSTARREFRRVLLELLRAETGSEEEFRAEARHLLGAPQ